MFFELDDIKEDIHYIVINTMLKVGLNHPKTPCPGTTKEGKSVFLICQVDRWSDRFLVPRNFDKLLIKLEIIAD